VRNPDRLPHAANFPEGVSRRFFDWAMAEFGATAAEIEVGVDQRGMVHVSITKVPRGTIPQITVGVTLEPKK
jgi:hypothetical protein